MALLLAMLGSAAPLHATGHSNIATGAWVGDPAYGEVRLVSAVSAMGDLEALPLGLEFRLAPGWKIYWRTPGEAGLPPTLDLQWRMVRRCKARLNGQCQNGLTPLALIISAMLIR